MNKTLLATGLLACSLLLGACGGKEEAAAPALYNCLGITEGVARIVDGLIANMGAETAIPNSVMLRSHKPMLDAVNSVNGLAPTDATRLQRLRNNFVDQLGEAAGGPLTYKGLSMLTAHRGMAVTAKESSVWREQLEASLNSKKVSANDKVELYVIIDCTYNDVAGH